MSYILFSLFLIAAKKLCKLLFRIKMPVEENLYILNKLARFFEISLPQLISQR